MNATLPALSRLPNAGNSYPASDRDLELIQKARTNDQTAMSALWNRYQAPLCAFFHKNVRHKEEAEDLASETLLTALAQIPAFRGKSEDSPEKDSASCTFQTYLYAIARNKLAGWIKRKKRGIYSSFTELNSQETKEGQDLEAQLGIDQDTDPLNMLLRREQREQALAAFSEVQRRSANQWIALRCHYIRDMSHKEIAAILDLPEKTVNSRLQEGRRSMRRYCDQVNQIHAV